MLVNTRRKEICDKVWTELTHEFENAKAAFGVAAAVASEQGTGDSGKCASFSRCSLR